MMWRDDLSWGPWLAMTVSMLVFWGLVIWAAVALLRRPSGDRARSAEDTLAERYARGEIDDEEYEHRRDLLRNGHGTEKP